MVAAEKTLTFSENGVTSFRPLYRQSVVALKQFPRISRLMRPLMHGTSLSARLVTTALGPFSSISTVIRSTSVMPMGSYAVSRADSSSLFVLGEGDTALTGRFLDSGDATSRRGGSGADAGLGPLWPPAADEAHSWSSTHQARRAATRAPTPLHASPAPTRCP